MNGGIKAQPTVTSSMSKSLGEADDSTQSDGKDSSVQSHLCDKCGYISTSTVGLQTHYRQKHTGKIEHLHQKWVTCQNCQSRVLKKKKDLKEGRMTFCGQECHGEYHEDRIKTECDACGVGMSVKPNRYEKNENNYCSPECYHSGRTLPDVEYICDYCGEVDSRRPSDINTDTENIFCSQECLTEWKSETWVGDRHPAGVQNGIDHPAWKGGKRLIHQVRLNLSRNSWQSVAKECRKLNDYRCELCGVHQSETPQRLHAHHIVPVAAGGTNDQELLMPLCLSCHKTVESYTNKIPEVEALFKHVKG